MTWHQSHVTLPAPGQRVAWLAPNGAELVGVFDGRWFRCAMKDAEAEYLPTVWRAI